jgi:drug/metabolite transporter (DMT)-like permease
VAVLLALLAAGSWGSSDYAAGVASRRSSALSVVVLTHAVSAAVLALVVLGPSLATVGGVDLAVVGADAAVDGRARLTLDLLLPAGLTRIAPLADLLWGAVAGISGGVGAVLLFRGLARGAVTVVAPVTAVLAAVLPVVAGVLSGESLGVIGAGAVATALIARVMIAEPPSVPARHARRTGVRSRVVGSRRDGARHGRRSPSARHRASGGGTQWALGRPAVPGMVEAIGSGLGFGGFYLLLDHASGGAGAWPVLSARTASAVLFTLAALMSWERPLPRRGDRWVVVVAGVLDAVATAAFLAATHRGLLAVVAVLSSLYPAATIGLARLIDRERCSRGQLAGLGMAAVSVGVLAIT